MNQFLMGHFDIYLHQNVFEVHFVEVTTKIDEAKRKKCYGKKNEFIHFFTFLWLSLVVVLDECDNVPFANTGPPLTALFTVVVVLIVFVINFFADVEGDWLLLKWKPCVLPFVKWCWSFVTGGRARGGRCSVSVMYDDLSDGISGSCCVPCLENVDPLDGGIASGCWCNAWLPRKCVWCAVFNLKYLNQR